MKKRYLLLLAPCIYSIWSEFNAVERTISVRIGQSFDEVARESTFPVRVSSNIPDNPLGSGATWVKEPAVVIQYADPEHGFTLPATTFAAISYMDGKVDTIATSPMLRKVSFSEAFETLSNLQHQFQAGGWQLDNGSEWYDLSPRGRQKLHRELRKISNGYVETKELVIPQKYSMIFRIGCAANCDSRIGRDLYLIDIGLAHDFGYEIEKLEKERELTP